MPLRLFQSRNVAGANLVMGLLVVGFFGMFFLGALYMQRHPRLQPARRSGSRSCPRAWSWGRSRSATPRRSSWGSARGPRCSPALGFIVGGLLLFARAPVDANYIVDVFPVMVLLGLGAGVAFPALMTLAMSGATPQDSGLASGLVNTTVQVGGAIGLAVLATVSRPSAPRPCSPTASPRTRPSPAATTSRS